MAKKGFEYFASGFEKAGEKVREGKKHQAGWNKALDLGLLKASSMSEVYANIAVTTKEQKSVLDNLAAKEGERFTSILQRERNLRDGLATERQRLDVAKDLLASQDAGTKTFKVASKLLNDQEKQVRKIEGRYGDVRTRIEGIKGPLETLLKATPLRGLVTVVDKFKEFNRAATSIQRAGKFQDVLTGYIDEATVSAGLFSKQITAVFHMGLIGGLKKAIPLMGILGVAIKGLFLTLAPILGIITGIIALIFVFKKVWDFNVGGIQTGFFRIVGQLKTIWGKFMAAMSRGLAVLGPMFKGVFDIIFFTIKPFLDILESVISIFNRLPKFAKGVTLAIIGISAAMLMFNASTGGVLILVGLLSIGFSKLPDGMKKVAGGIVIMTFAMRKFGIATGGLLVLSGILVIALSELPPWMTAVAIGIGIMTIAWIKHNVATGGLIIVIGALVTGFTFMGPVFKTVAGALMILVGALIAFHVVTGGVLLGIGVIVTGLVMLTVGLVKLFKKAGGFKSMWSMLGKIAKAFWMITNPVQFLIAMFAGMKLPGWLQKVLDFFTGGRRGGTTEEKADKSRQITSTALSPQTNVNNTWSRQQQNIANNNQQITIQTSGNIDAKQAPRVGDIIVGALTAQGQVQ